MNQTVFVNHSLSEHAHFSIDVSIVIVNYNGAKFLEKLFSSLSIQTFSNFEVIFVDNHSQDNSLEVLEKTLAVKSIQNLRIKIFKNKENLGYCRGNNIGLSSSDGTYVVFLNNDTYVSETWLEELVNVMNADSMIGACQSRLIQPDNGCVKNDGHVLDFFGWSQSIVVESADVMVSDAPVFVSGASFIARKNDLVRIGGFDGELFLGDYDLCWRLRLLGYKMAVALRSICYHYGGSTMVNSTLASQIKTAYHYEKERPRVLLKVYSKGHLIKRAPVLVALMNLETISTSLKFKNPLFILGFAKALGWNLKEIQSTLLARFKVQRSRLINDRDIERKMPHYIILLTRQLVVKK